MKTRLFFSFVICVLCQISNPIIGQQAYQASSEATVSKILDVKTVDEIMTVADHVFEDGTVRFSDGVALNDISIWNIIKTNEHTTFVLERESKSLHNPLAAFRRYQQYYKGIPVQGGGYSVKIIYTDETKSAYALDLFSPNVFQNIHVETSPKISEKSIDVILGGKNSDAKLYISNKFTPDFQLLWNVYHSGDLDEIIWLDANSGNLVHRVESSLELTANTPYYGIQSLHDFTYIFTTTLATPSGRLRIYGDLDNLTQPVDTDEWDLSFIPTTTNYPDWGNGATASSLQTTGNLINVLLPHLDSTITPRSQEIVIKPKTIDEGIISINYLPNPFNGSSIEVKIINSTNKNTFTLKILDINGKLLKTIQLKSDIEVVSIDGPPGVYIALLLTNGELIHAANLIKI